MNISTPRDRLWRKRLDELTAVWPDFVSGRGKALHKTRVASRRIREALPIVGAGASAAKVKKLSRKMRTLTRSLGPIRELDVELHLLENTSGIPGVPDRVIEIVRREVASRRQALRDELTGDGPVTDLKKLLKKLERVAERRPKGQTHKAKRKLKAGQDTRNAEVEFGAQWRGVLAARLVRRARSLAGALEDAGALYVPERLHVVRISIKKLRYALEIAGDVGVKSAAALVKVLKRHQERLGHMHDLQVLLKHVRETEASPGVGSRVNDLASYAESLDRQCRRLHAGFVERRAEVASVVKDVRHQVVPSLTTQPRRQAHVSGARASARPRRAK